MGANGKNVHPKKLLAVFLIALIVIITFSVYLEATSKQFTLNSISITEIMGYGKCPVCLPQDHKEKLSDDMSRLFKPLVAEKDIEGLKLALEVFDNVTYGNVTWMMYAGTLLGSYRHHGFIPWDKDMDLLVKREDMDSLEELLESQKPQYELTKLSSHVWRFCNANATVIHERHWKWPYVDIFFYVEDDTNLWATFKDEVHLKYPKKDIFPMIRRPFMDMLLPSPRNYKKILDMKFKSDKCRSNIYSLNDNGAPGWKKAKDVSCDTLKHLYPFVYRNCRFNETHCCELSAISNSTHCHPHRTYFTPKETNL